jgi:hypothetical protein
MESNRIEYKRELTSAWSGCKTLVMPQNFVSMLSFVE